MSSSTLTTGAIRPDGSKPLSSSIPHPLDQLSAPESNAARDVILAARGSSVAINFRSIFLEEPPKKELSQFLELEHSDRLNRNIPRLARLAKIQYDVVRGNKEHEYMESVVDVVAGKEIHQRVVDKVHQPGLTTCVVLFAST